MKRLWLSILCVLLLCGNVLAGGSFDSQPRGDMKHPDDSSTLSGLLQARHPFLSADDIASCVGWWDASVPNDTSDTETLVNRVDPYFPLYNPTGATQGELLSGSPRESPYLYLAGANYYPEALLDTDRDDTGAEDFTSDAFALQLDPGGDVWVNIPGIGDPDDILGLAQYGNGGTSVFAQGTQTRVLIVYDTADEAAGGYVGGGNTTGVSQLGVEQSAGSLAADGLVYQIVKTQTNYFFPGCGVSDYFTAFPSGVTLALDANNTVQQVLQPGFSGVTLYADKDLSSGGTVWQTAAFNPNDVDRVVVYRSTLNFTTEDFTINIAVKLDDGQPAAFQQLIGKWDKNGYRSYRVILDSDGTIKFDLTSTGAFQAGGRTTTDNPVFSDGAQSTFTVISVVYNNTTQTTVIYINGEEVSTSDGGGIPVSLYDTFYPLTIGYLSPASNYYTGSIGHISLFTTALSADKIKHIWLRESGYKGW